MSQLTKIQEIQLGIFKEFDSFCKENNIPYFIIGGTVIGAVRHKGFIPWDDDIDVGLLRKDYDKFVSMASQKWTGKYRIKNYKITKDFYHSLTHAVDTTVRILDNERINPVSTNVWIDVNPLDGFPNDGIKQKIHYYRLRMIKNLIVLSNFEKLFDLNKERSKPIKVIIAIIRVINPFKILSTKKLIEKLESVLRSHNTDDSPCIGNFVGRYGKKEIMRKKVFSEKTMLQFEDIIVPVMKDYDEYLRNLYGDYMQLPPKEKQINRHAMEIIE